MSVRWTSIPGLPPLLACLGLLALWELAARAFQISGLPPAHEALRQLPSILGDLERDIGECEVARAALGLERLTQPLDGNHGDSLSPLFAGRGLG